MSIELLNLDQLIPNEIFVAISPGLLEILLADIADGARAEWIRVAGAGLSGSQGEYLDSIQQVQMRPGQAVISLVGVVANIIEEGMPETDMHDTLLGPNVPISEPGNFGKHIKISAKTFASGFYRAIPFRHSVPGMRGLAGGVMGTQYKGHTGVADAKKLGQTVYNLAKRLQKTTSEPGGPTKYGGRLGAGLAPLLKSHHKTDIYAGMVRERKTYKRKTQTQYTTFRTISTGSPGWIRPATRGRFFAREVAAYVAKVAPATFAAFVEGMG